MCPWDDTQYPTSPASRCSRGEQHIFQERSSPAMGNRKARTSTTRISGYHHVQRKHPFHVMTSETSTASTQVRSQGCRGQRQVREAYSLAPNCIKVPKERIVSNMRSAVPGTCRSSEHHLSPRYCTTAHVSEPRCQTGGKPSILRSLRRVRDGNLLAARGEPLLQTPWVQESCALTYQGPQSLVRWLIPRRGRAQASSTRPG